MFNSIAAEEETLGLGLYFINFPKDSKLSKLLVEVKMVVESESES